MHIGQAVLVSATCLGSRGNGLGPHAHWQKGWKQSHKTSTTAPQTCWLQNLCFEKSEPYSNSYNQVHCGISQAGTQVACPKHIHFAKSDCHCMGNTPFSSYQLRQQLSGSVPYWKFGLVPLIDDHHCFNGMRWHCFFTGQKETLPSEHHLWKIWFKCEKSPSLTFCLEVPSPAEGLSAPLPACSVAR